MFGRMYGIHRRRIDDRSHGGSASEPSEAQPSPGGDVRNQDVDTAKLREYLDDVAKWHSFLVRIAVFRASDVRPEVYLKRALKGRHSPPYGSLDDDEAIFHHWLTLFGTRFDIIFDFWAPGNSYRAMSMRDHLFVFAYREDSQDTFDIMLKTYEETVTFRSRLNIAAPWSGAVLALVDDPSKSAGVSASQASDFARSKGLAFLRACPRDGIGCSTQALECLIKSLLLQRATDTPKYTEIDEPTGP